MVDNVLIAEDTPITDHPRCSSCNAVLKQQSKFCGICGARLQIPDGLDTHRQFNLLKQAAVFFAVNLKLCCAAKFLGYFNTASWQIIIDALLCINSAFFFIYNWNNTKSLLSVKGLSLAKFSLFGGLAMLAGVMVHYSVNWLNLTIFTQDEVIYGYYSPRQAAILVFLIAVVPAVFEELGFRGYLVHVLLKVVDREQVIYISAFLFAIIHLNVLSLFWLLPFAWILGYIRIKENTLWYGIFIHFMFNLTACLFQLLS